MERPDWAVIVAAILSCLFVPAEGFAGDGLTGRWTYSTVVQNGEIAVWTLDLKQDGDKVTGTFSFSGGAVSIVEEGKVAKDRLSFKVKGSTDVAGPVKSTFSGKLKGDELDLTSQAELKGKIRPGLKGVFKRSRVPEKQAK